MNRPATAPDLAAEQARAARINDRCERFEAAWRVGERPAIEDELAAAAEGDRRPLLIELLALEVELRRESGEAVDFASYLQRFPGKESAVREALQGAQEVSVALAPGDPQGWKTVNVAESPGFALPPAAGGDRPFRPGEERLGDYVLLEEVARGGMGVVYKARHEGLKRTVALKMILAGAMATPAERARFRREAELAANLDHPNIVPIYEVREHDNVLYFTMRFVGGGNLSRRIANGPRDPAAAARLVGVLARAVQHAHERGFFHCDLKPSNILLDAEGQPQITDFGLARRSTEESSLTATGAVLGTPSYMAPEQASGQRASIGPATDVYGLGAILYELLTGRPPFRTPTVMETIVHVLERDPVPPRELDPAIPRQLETICLKCLEKLPEERYESARELADDLGRFLDGEAVEATGIFHRLRRWTRREPELVSRVGGLAVISALTEFNRHALSPMPDARLHYKIQCTLLAWALSAILFQFLWRRGWRSDGVRRLWSSADIICLTACLLLLGKSESTLLIGYPLLIAASGLWFRVRLVWFTTAMAIVGYLILYTALAIDWSMPLVMWTNDELQYPNIFIAALWLTGYVVVRQVRRILALGRYYEQSQREV
ncbi:Serine/threonine-protein kinase PrkC [Aquisphaera giovannonii]|uniref:non-specific serine/threonine protein kinase n=1 Tax=Aquisphaera giovannonii TaxID=406548 RepID=A0A5B9W0T0_9BACT|nr:serine/threonine-protein kinase [Aquisphaera giovannonii]QEH33565.1 Serine/threonine-protein kinase PrkC [Aquisphaera giovannonii]